MKLAIFDIDGTLTKTNAVDNDCYIQATQHCIDKGFKVFEEESFTHFTDSSILVELYQKYKNRLPSTTELNTFKTFYLDLLKKSHAQDSTCFEAIVGANEVIPFLVSRGWQVALATGCWAESAQLKLSLSGVDVGNTFISTASNALTRHEIMQNAINHIDAKNKTKNFEHIVYIGDGIWDYKTCALMQVPFVGIEAEGNKHKQKLLGDFLLLSDYLNLEEVEQQLNLAKVPNKRISH